MSALRWLGPLALAGVVGGAVIYRSELAVWMFNRRATPHTHADESIAHYTCSMDPSVEATEPGSCPICGMALTPVTKEDRASDVVRIGTSGRQRIGARVVAVKQSTLRQRILAVGVVGATTVSIDANIYQGLETEVPIGHAVGVTVAELPLSQFAGTVVVSNAPQLRIDLENRDGVLQPGMHATVQIDLERTPQLVVPAEAVVYAGSRRFVFVDRGGGRFEPRTVKLGLQAAGLIEVLDGVAAGDPVLTAGVFLVAAESRVRSAGTLWTEPVAPMLGAPKSAGP